MKANHNKTEAGKEYILLLPKIQRTKVESKSQPGFDYPALEAGCYQKYKEQKLKANHNTRIFTAFPPDVVTKNTKNKS